MKLIHFTYLSITLQDIAIITGLPIDGNAMCEPTNLDWGIVCENLLGVTPPTTALAYDSLKIIWVRNTFSNLPEGANAVTTQQYARAYIFQVLALLFGNKSQSRLHCYFFQLLVDFGVAGLVPHLLFFIKSYVLLLLKKARRLQVLFSYYDYGPGSIFHI